LGVFIFFSQQKRFLRPEVIRGEKIVQASKMTNLIAYIVSGVIVALVLAYLMYKFVRKYFVPTPLHPIPIAPEYAPLPVHDLPKRSQNHTTAHIINLDVGRFEKPPKLNQSTNFVRLSDSHALGEFVADVSDDSHTIIRFEHGTIKTPHWDDPGTYDPRQFMVVEDK
jgi:hypothetical protein